MMVFMMMKIKIRIRKRMKTKITDVCEYFNIHLFKLKFLTNLPDLLKVDSFAQPNFLTKIFA